MRFIFWALYLLGFHRGAFCHDDEPWDEEDYYSLLGLNSDANTAGIKRAYRRLSLEHHPDTSGATEMFQKISRAYQVLSDRDLRRVYDQRGAEGVEEYEKQKAMGEQRMNDPFARMFGGFGQQETKRPPIEIPLFVTLKDLYLSKTLEASAHMMKRCKKCRGTGAKTKKDMHTCPICRGQGVTVGVHHIGGGMYQQVRQMCTGCQGTGKVVVRQCPHCQGKKIVESSDNVSIEVSKGMAEGQAIVFDSMCDEIAGSTDAPGDVRFVVSTIPSESLQRVGNDLHLAVKLTLGESLGGFKRMLEHLDGHRVAIERSGSVTPHGYSERFRGEGMPIFERNGNFGDLIIKYEIEFPAYFSDNQRDLIDDLLRK